MDFENMMQQLMGGMMGGAPGKEDDMQMPDISQFTKLLGQMGLSDKMGDNGVPDIDENKMKESQKMFEDCMS